MDNGNGLLSILRVKLDLIKTADIAGSADLGIDDSRLDASDSVVRIQI